MLALPHLPGVSLEICFIYLRRETGCARYTGSINQVVDKSMEARNGALVRGAYGCGGIWRSLNRIFLQAKHNLSLRYVHFLGRMLFAVPDLWFLDLVLTHLTKQGTEHWRFKAQRLPGGLVTNGCTISSRLVVTLGVGFTRPEERR